MLFFNAIWAFSLGSRTVSLTFTDLRQKTRCMKSFHCASSSPPPPSLKSLEPGWVTRVSLQGNKILEHPSHQNVSFLVDYPQEI